MAPTLVVTPIRVNRDRLASATRVAIDRAVGGLTTTGRGTALGMPAAPSGAAAALGGVGVRVAGVTGASDPVDVAPAGAAGAGGPGAGRGAATAAGGAALLLVAAPALTGRELLAGGRPAGDSTWIAMRWASWSARI